MAGRVEDLSTTGDVTNDKMRDCDDRSRLCCCGLWACGLCDAVPRWQSGRPVG